MAVIGTGGQVEPGVKVRVVKQSAITALGTSGTSTVTQLETKINAIITALQAAGVTA